MEVHSGGLGDLEALAWLQRRDGKQRCISGSFEQQIADGELLSLVRELYAAGATHVLAIDVTDEGDWEDSDGLRVFLPDDRTQRSALFAIQARALSSMGSGSDPDGESGQAYFGLDW